mgnify:CR=1 FL=1
MGIYGAVVAAVSDLCGLGSFDIYVWGCGARPMGLIYGARDCGTRIVESYGMRSRIYGAVVWVSVVVVGAVSDLWG